MRSATGVVDGLVVMVDVEGVLVDVIDGDVLLVVGSLIVVIGGVVVDDLTVVTGGVVGDFSIGVVMGLDVVVMPTVIAVDVFGTDVLVMLVVVLIIVVVEVVVLVGAFEVDEDLLGVEAVVKAVVPVVEFRTPRAVVAFAVVVFDLPFLAMFP